MSVKVVARIRPLLKSELDKDIIVTAHRQPANTASSSPSNDPSASSIIHIPNPKNEAENFTFSFNRVFESHTTQKELFEAEIKPTIKHLFNGYDVTLFAYGVTGTGKTHTMRGGKSLEDRGIIPRLLSALYRKSRAVKEKDSDAQVEVSMSYYEIYNDKVFDLFEAPEKRNLAGLPLRDNGSRTVVVGLTERPCEDLKTFERLYDQANVNRRTSATKLNAHSSRSHAILCVKLSITQGERTLVSTASCIDLAGSEDNRRTENNRERLVESSAINKSLFVLGQCVEAISKGQNRVPYRESKMTRILSPGQNNGLCICLLNLSPIRSYHLDTLSSLNFANRTKKIEVREVENEPVFHNIPRPAANAGTGIPGIARQPLKALSSTAHNVNPKCPSAGDGPVKPGYRPRKMFLVYADKSRPLGGARRSSGAKRASPGKRLSGGSADSCAKSSKRSPLAPRTQPATRPELTRENLENLVEEKVREMLAAKALEAPVNAQPEISEDVRKRLEMLEQKVEAKGGEDERAEGLSYLLMAKQHMVRGEEGSALKMYELAKEYFPENAKLQARIRKLKDKAQQKKNAYLGKENVAPETAIEASNNHAQDEDDDQYHPEDEEEVPNDYDFEFRRRTSANKKTCCRRTKAQFIPFADPVSTVALKAAEHKSDVLTPRGKQVLSIINTRDVHQIRALKGVGVKKAEGIVEAMTDEEMIPTLKALAALRGVGAKTVDNMRVGLGSGVTWGN